MIAFLFSLALAGKWDGHESNIVAEVDIDAPIEVVLEQFLDLHTLDLYSDECLSEKTIGEPNHGFGAPFRVRYHAGPWSRLVEGQIADIGHRHVDWEHTGNYGFTTRYAVTPSEDGPGSHVVMTTFLGTPVWPFRGLFFTRVRPGWTACHAELLAAVAAELDGQHVEPQVMEVPLEPVSEPLTEPVLEPVAEPVLEPAQEEPDLEGTEEP